LNTGYVFSQICILDHFYSKKEKATDWSFK